MFQQKKGGRRHNGIMKTWKNVLHQFLAYRVVCYYTSFGSLPLTTAQVCAFYLTTIFVLNSKGRIYGTGFFLTFRIPILTEKFWWKKWKNSGKSEFFPPRVFEIFAPYSRLYVHNSNFIVFSKIQFFFRIRKYNFFNLYFSIYEKKLAENTIAWSLKKSKNSWGDLFKLCCDLEFWMEFWNEIYFFLGAILMPVY